jgi:putative methionine-R-sulfoxide reductase with GAF domain
MNFFRDRSLRRLAAYILSGMFLIFLAEYLTIQNKIEVLEEIEEKKDFARSAQLSSQQIAFLVEVSKLEGTTDPQILARLVDQEHILSVLGHGGRIDGSDFFLQPLSRLPAITFEHLNENWQSYKQNITSLLTPEREFANSPVVVADSIHKDSVATRPLTTDSTVAQQNNRPRQKINKITLASQGLTLSTWYERLLSDLTEEANSKKASVERWFFAFIIIDVLLLCVVFFLFYKYVLQPLRELHTNTINRKQDQDLPPNELGELGHQVNIILEQLKDATEFVAAIGEGKLDFDYKSLDHDYTTGSNKLADSLIVMQDKLKVLNEEEQRRKWANEGLTKFVDILRSSNDNINTLGDKIISALVQYTNSNQGGLYVLNDEDEHHKYLELISLFAFDARKFEKQKVKLGEGILGQTFLERETTLLNEIPQEYIRITSGLGGANPKSLLIVPLKVDKEVYGIVELASFKSYQQYEIEFVEKLAETIASTLASVKAAQKNRNLIEQFQQQTEIMRAQEEEMRQNMEELQATQEEMARKERDYIERIQSLESQTAESMSKEQFNESHEQLIQRESELQGRIRDLEKKLAEKPARGDDWALAEEVGKTLKIQLEALRITQEEIRKK